MCNCNYNVNGKQELDDVHCCGARIVKVHKPWHMCMALMSFTEPGSGCYFNSCCCHTEGENCAYGNIMYAWWMAVTACCICGLLNSMAFGVGIYRKACKWEKTTLMVVIALKQLIWGSFIQTKYFCIWKTFKLFVTYNPFLRLFSHFLINLINHPN